MTNTWFLWKILNINVKILKVIGLQKLTFKKIKYRLIIPILLFYYFLYNFRPESLFNIVKQYVFGGYQNIQFENPGFFLYVSIVFYFLTFFYSKKHGEMSRFFLFIVLYDLFDIFKSWTQNKYLYVVYLVLLTLFYFNISMSK